MNIPRPIYGLKSDFLNFQKIVIFWHLPEEWLIEVEILMNQKPIYEILLPSMDLIQLRHSDSDACLLIKRNMILPSSICPMRLVRILVDFLQKKPKNHSIKLLSYSHLSRGASNQTQLDLVVVSPSLSTHVRNSKKTELLRIPCFSLF